MDRGGLLLSSNSCFIFFINSGTGQEVFQILTLQHYGSTPKTLVPISNTVGVSVDQEKVYEVSTSILMAEKWLKTNVLSHYPSTNITSIVVSNSLFSCDENEKVSKDILKVILVAMGNIYHSLVRWGLEKNIKVSVLLTPNCLQKTYLKPIFEFLKNINSTYTIQRFELFDVNVEISSSYLKPMSDLSGFQLKTFNLLKNTNPRSRKLSFIVRSSEIDNPVPSDAVISPLPRLIGDTSPPPFSPEIQPPMTAPPHYGVDLPPCNPYRNPRHTGGTAPPPAAAAPAGRERLWCVAKPSVPAETLQEAIDFACGEGGADCDEISPTGNCYFPDSIVAHASYAFNSYWQKNKKHGGTCGFGGTAMLINSDPSFLHCHFTFGQFLKYSAAVKKELGFYGLD
ncbi:glucan endo-1,3-beta-glucosidase 1-like [Rutidosis leptorrhynchoides]|uniref:glucan endo-1,3-beta-glucosidase 1-like n=1 Tax=Rutidosis leptorrhynchoides TaxID=125765 RepID=UPI003A999A42